MLTVRPIHRAAIVCALACALLISSLIGTAAAGATVDAPEVISSQIFTDRERAMVERFKRTPSYKEALREAAPEVTPPQVFTDRERAMVASYKRSPSYQEALREAVPDVTPPQPTRVRSDGGIDWGDAGIGAGALLGVIALGFAGAMTILHRRRRTATAG
jgi:hypothetical protein